MVNLRVATWRPAWQEEVALLTLDGWLAWALALLVYPGLLFALGLALLADALLDLAARRGVTLPTSLLNLVLRPTSGSASGWGLTGEALLAGWSAVAPLLALLLLPLPGHPLLLAARLNNGIPLTGSAVAILILIGSGPLALAALGLGSTRSGAQIGGARLARQAGLALLPLGLALAALATAGSSNDLGVAIAGASDAPWVRLLAALGVLLAIPALGQWPPANRTGPDPVTGGADGVLAGLYGPPLFFARLGILLQRAALLALLLLALVPGVAATVAEPLAGWIFMFLLPLPPLLLGFFFANRAPWPPDRAAAICFFAGLPLGLIALFLAALSRG